MVGGVIKRMAKRQRWSRERIIEEIRHLHRQGIPLNMASVRRVASSLVATACSRKYFGSWRAAVEAAGFDYDEVVRVRRWTPERVIAEILALHQQGASLRPSAIMNVKQTLLTAARKHFGSWRSAVEAAGIDYAAYMRQRQDERAEADKHQIIAEIRRLYEEGRIDELRGAWRYHLSLFRKARHRFGSWRKAIEAAGLDYEEIVSRRKWTKEQIIREIQRLYAEGKDLSVTAMQRHHPSLLAIAQSPHYFGSWHAAIQAAGLDYELIKRQRGRRRREPVRAKVTVE